MHRIAVPVVTLTALALLVGCNEPRNNVDTLTLNKEMEDRYIKMDPYGPDAPFLVFKKEPVLTQSDGCIYITQEPRPYIMSAKEFREWSGTAISAERAQRIIDEATLQRQLVADINVHLSGLADTLDSNAKNRRTAADAEAQAGATRADHQRVSAERDALNGVIQAKNATLVQETDARRQAEVDAERSRMDRDAANAAATKATRQAQDLSAAATAEVAATQRENEALNKRIALLGAQVQVLLTDRSVNAAQLATAQTDNMRLTTERDALAASAAGKPPVERTEAMAAELANANRQLDANTTLLTQLVADNRRLSSQLRDALDQMAAAQRILDGTVQGQDKSAIATSVLAQLAATAKRFQDLPTGSPDRAILQQDLRIYAGILTRQTGQSVPADIHALLGQDP